MMEFFGLKTTAWFDVWSIEHILSGVSIGNLVKKDNNKHVKKIAVIQKFETSIAAIRFDVIGVLFLAYLWETVEHYLEIGIAGQAVEHWFQGVEFWGNRIITDPLMMVLGYYIALKKPQWVAPARILSLVWLVVHIFVFPHSMYLHTMFS